MTFNRRNSWQRARLTAQHPGGRQEVLTSAPSPAVWALYAEIRERELLPDTVRLDIAVTAEHRSPFAP